MPKCSGTLAPVLRSRLHCMKGRLQTPALRELAVPPPRRTYAALAQNRGPRAIDADHAALIDPSSLRSTLDAVRAANRTSLIRKVDKDGNSRRLSLPAILEIPLKEQSQDAAITKRSIIRYTSTRTRKSAQSPSSEPAGYVPDVSPEWNIDRRTRARFRMPWLLQLDEETLIKAVSSRTRLVTEMEAFNVFSSPSAAEQAAATEAIRDLQHVVSSRYPNMRVETMGSRATGVAMPLSDIDVNLVPGDETRPDVVEHRGLALNMLKRLANTTRKINKGLEVGESKKLVASELVHRARVPILRLHHLQTGLEMQVQYTNDGYNTTEYAKKFFREHPTLKALFRVLRQALAIRGLTDSRFGGLGSYPLLNMIVASLKSQELKTGSQNVADQLIYFLDLYSEIELLATGIRVVPFELYPRQTKGNDRDVKDCARMYLEDPADPSNNLGGSAYRFRDIQATFIALRTLLQKGMDRWDQTLQSSPKDIRHWSLLSILVGGNYRTFQLSRIALVQKPGPS